LTFLSVDQQTSAAKRSTICYIMFCVTNGTNSYKFKQVEYDHFTFLSSLHIIYVTKYPFRMETNTIIIEFMHDKVHHVCIHIYDIYIRF